MNQVVISGNLTQDAVVETDEKGKKTAKFTVAVNDDQASRNNKEEYPYWDCICFDNKAEFVEKGLAMGRYRQGCLVELNGRLVKRQYVTKGGQKRIWHGIVVEKSFSRLQEKNPMGMNRNSYMQAGYNGYAPTPAPEYGYNPANTGWAQMDFNQYQAQQQVQNYGQRMQYQTQKVGNGYYYPTP